MTHPVTTRKAAETPSFAGETVAVTSPDKPRHNKGVTFCPTCDHPIPSDDLAAGFGQIQRMIYEIIRDAGQEGIHRERLEQLVYGNSPYGGPATNSVGVMICRNINPALQARGLYIRSRGRVFRMRRIGS